MTNPERQTTAALAMLILLQFIVLSALYAGIRPHPPEATPLFGIAPFLGVAMGTALSAIILQTLRTRAGRLLCVVAALMALVSFGPQKYLDAQFGLIWPAVIFGQMSALSALFHAVQAYRQSRSRGVRGLSAEQP